MNYSKFQKFISSFLIFSLLFGITFRVPIFNFSAFAGNSDFYNLVSVIVDEDTYDEVESEIERYASDIQSVLENTRVVIMPTPTDATAFEIASLNESLYNEGYKSVADVNFESKLIGTVLVGNFNLPLAYKNEKSARTILPFTDFEDKSYIYNHLTNRYEYNFDNLDGIKPEVWHGVISPNTGDYDEDINLLKDYFDKNHDFYEGTGNFQISEGIINGNLEETIPNDYKPFVFYFDSFRESSAINYNSYIGYKGYLENKEDINYKRYTKELARKLKSEIMGVSQNEIYELAKKINPDLDIDEISNDASLENAPDIQTRYVTNNIIKKFVEVFSKGSIGELRKDVHNAGRYNDGRNVNVDFIPYLITVLDIVNDEFVKEINDELESEIDKLVENGLSRKIAIPTYFLETKNEGISNGINNDTSSGDSSTINQSITDTYLNILYGKKSTDITSAQECSIYRGSTFDSGKLVEANRGLNVNNIEKDKVYLDKDYGENPNYYCWQNVENGKAFIGRFGGNTPFNLDQDKTTSGILELSDHDLRGSIIPLFDIGGTKEIEDDTKNPSPLMCLDNNYFLIEDNSIVSVSEGDTTTSGVETVFRNPIGGETIKWSCAKLPSKYNFSKSYEQNIKDNPETNNGGGLFGIGLGSCSGGCEDVINYNASGNNFSITKTYYECVSSGESDSCQPTGEVDEWKYKFIPSDIKHKSPTSEELTGQLKSMIARDLPVDKNRYIDFISAKGDYTKIEYPYLFRVNASKDGRFDFEIASELLDEYLDKKSEEINKIIDENKPTLSGVDLEIYNYLKTGNYPESNFDLKEYLKNKGSKTITIEGESKTLSYYDILVFSVYWNNLKSVSSKYGFVFENYLSDQTDNAEQFFLPKNKKQYEIAYLGSSGDAQNMFIGVDPERKSTNPYSNIVGLNQDLSAKLLGLNISPLNTGDKAIFKCAPPDGVPIWEWIPAIMCRLGDMMPPTISISDGACGPSLLSNDEKEELKECNGDVNKNGVNDCIENKLTGASLLLESDSNRYNYNSNISLKSTLKDKNDKTVRIANSTNIRFEITKIEEILNSNTEVVYDKYDINLSDNSVFSKYLEFKNLDVRSSAGVSKYSLSVKNKDINVYLQTYVYLDDNDENIVADLESNILKLEVREDRLFTQVSSYNKSGENYELNFSDSSIKANDKYNVFLFDGNKNNFQNISNNLDTISEENLLIQVDNLSKNGNKKNLDYPLSIEIFDGNKKLIQKEEEIYSLGIKKLIALQKSGNYEIIIKDSLGNFVSRKIDILPSDPEKLDIQLGSNYVETGGVITTNYVTVLDKFGNPVSGEYFDYNLSLSDNSLVFVDNEDEKLTTSSVEGYVIFRTKSLNEIGTNRLKIVLNDFEGNKLLEASKVISVLDGIQVTTKELTGDIKVGGSEYKHQIAVRDSSGNILSSFNSRVYMNIDSNFVNLKKPYFNLEGGAGVIEFTTNTASAKNIPVEFQIEGLNSIINDSITILPESPIKMDLILSKYKMEASQDDKSILTVELKDRYNNLVFTDNDTNLDLEIRDEYSHIITSPNTSKQVNDGIAQFELYGTDYSGLAYFKVTSDPSLSLNKFFVEDESGKLEVSGVGENSGKIETFYYWNKDKLEGKTYNALYTTLLGSNYGDIEQKDYLAGSIIFDKNNRALSVTSLLNNLKNTNDVISISNNGGLDSIYNPNDLSQDISYDLSFDGKNIYFRIYNRALNTYIGKIYYKVSDDNYVGICEDNINDCLKEDENNIILKSFSEDYNVLYDDDKIVLRDNLGKNHIEISEDGTIVRKSALEYILEENNDYLIISIKSGNDIIGKLYYKFDNFNINISRDEEIFENKKDLVEENILVYLDSNFYGTYDIGKSNDISKIIYYNDPFSSDSQDEFSKGNLYAYENFDSRGGAGWKEENKTLLSFSAGETVGESLKDNMSFSAINIGDPVVSIKKQKKNIPKTTKQRQFDSTIGKIVTSSDGIHSYRIFDYDNDNKQDILLIKNDNYFELLENKSLNGDFVNKGNLSHITDLGNPNLVKVGDFNGDGFDDVFYVSEDGKPNLLHNKLKDFYKYPLAGQFDLLGRIVRAETFDLDYDGVFDIVTLDDAGELNIFYGKIGAEDPEFTKLNLAKDYGVVLNDNVRNDNSLVYFDGLYQIDSEKDLKEIILENEDYLASLQENISNESESNFTPQINEAQINNLIFEEVSYSKDNPITEFSFESLENVKDIENIYNQSYTFIKSDYSETAGIKVEKVFLDRNGDYIKSGDLVDVEIVLTNVSGKRLEDIAFIEKIENVFTLKENTINNSKDLAIKDPNNNYDFLIDNFSLNNNEELIINYTLEVKPIKYGFLEVGLFEKGEVGDDEFGDVILKNDNQNCSNPVRIFRSESSRSYSEGEKEPTCDENATKLPDELEQNSIDENNNNIPDYIEELTNDIDKAKDYAKEKLDNFYLDSDGDGIPNDEDNFNSNGVISNLTTIDEDIDSGLQNVEDFINGLSCGFNNGGCIATPLNWAPLAPGGDPTIFGFPIGDGLNVDEGLPIFSALTGMWYGPIWAPSVWPPSPLALEFLGSKLGAGGRLGIDSPSNFFRLFITPTLTGAVGTAICFGGTARVSAYANMPGISPLFPGGNCIVVTKPFLGCSGDGSDGDVASTGNPVYVNGFGYINGNCKTDTFEKHLKPEYAEKYYDYLNGNSSIADTDLETDEGALWEPGEVNSGPLFSINGGSGEEVSIKVDPDSKSIDFSDVTKVIQKRIKAFPNFLMDWVTRQIEEIVTKLTDFPTLFIILPDFSGVYDFDKSFDENRDSWKENSGNPDEYDLASIDGDLSVDTSSIENETLKNTGEKLNSGLESIDENTKGIRSGVKEAYEFLSSVPFVKIENEQVDMTLPWISPKEIDKTIASRKITIKQREQEISEASDSWSLGATCEGTTKEIEKCEEENKLRLDFAFKINGLLDSLKANIKVLEEYKKTPEKIYNYLNVKERYLEQILCNIESISTIMGGRISDNGERFKAWVELYILIKAILKSWQVLIDLFVDYEASCKECKNERMDLMTFIWKLISMVIPSIPVIQFPKWPDIIIDLHDIRAGLDIKLPEFNIDTKPILLLPELPNLYLPRVPNFSINAELDLPEIPVLPTFELPVLPDLPSLPTIELPNLPPPPKLPKILGELSAVLDILKLVTKAMCILKMSPFVPEWRAGDQIAFLTERSGHLPIDFIDINLPQFSFPFVDAIKVSTHVNLEFQVDFIVEMARQVAQPVNNFTADFTNIFDINTSDLDFRNLVPSDVNIDINNEGVESNIGYNEKAAIIFAGIVGRNVLSLTSYLEENKDNVVSNKEFKELVFSELAKENITSDPKLDELRGVWKNVENYTYSKENKLIKDLQDANTQKFETVKDIINTEIIKNKNTKNKLKEYIDSDNYIVNVGFDNNSGVEDYNDELEYYNKNFVEKAKALVNPDLSIEKEIKENGNDLISRINTPLQKYSEKLNNNLFADNTQAVNSDMVSANSCSAGNGDYEYKYEGIYVLEDGTSYRLFDYLDELIGDEEIKAIDMDNDNDEDLLYFVGGTLYLKENLKVQDSGNYVSDSPLVLETSDNKFFSGETFYESVNNVRELGVGNNYVNINFSAHSSLDINNYRLSTYQIIDKDLNERNINYRPKFVKKQIYDGISNIDNITFEKEDELYIQRNNLAYIKNVGDLKGVKLKTPELIDIRDNILGDNIVNISAGNIIYTGGETSVIKYLKDDNSVGSIIIPKYSNIELKNPIKIVGVTSGAYIESGFEETFEGIDILSMREKPLLIDSEISFVGNNYEVEDDSYIEIQYYDNSEISLDFEYDKSWKLLDLGYNSKDYLFSLVLENDFYYGKINSFKNNINSTLSKQILLSPQVSADDNSPELDMPSLRIPVYQKEIVDFTKYIFEDSGISGIEKAYIDFDLDVDSNGDGKKNNDNDSQDNDKINLIKTNSHLKFEFGKFEDLFKKDIGITLIDTNGNVGYYEVSFEVYSPTPQIYNFDGNKISGNIYETLEEEPVNIYRYRGGVIKKLSDVNGNNLSLTDDLGKYNLEVGETSSGVIFELSGEKVGFIDEKTGKINTLNPVFTKDVLSSNNNLNDVAYPKILVSDSNNDLFYQSIKLTNNSKVNIVEEFTSELDIGLYVKFLNTSNYNFYEVPTAVKYNPGSISIYRITDVNKEALFTIFRDGRIYTINGNYGLEYSEFEDYITIKLIDKHFNREVAEVLYKISGEYLIK